MSEQTKVLVRPCQPRKALVAQHSANSFGARHTRPSTIQGCRTLSLTIASLRMFALQLGDVYDPSAVSDH